LNGRGPEQPARPARGRRLFFRVVGIGLGAFLVGYALTTVLVFPGFGRQAVVTVPDLRGRPLAAARSLAEDAGVAVETGARLHHPTVREGAVLAQSPLPGQEVTRGAAVRVTLSAGRERRAVPEVADLPAAQAQALLARLGFTVRVRRVLSERAAGRVLGVNPAAGTLLPVPAPVELTLSAGPPEVVVPIVAVPDLGGLPEAEAREALRSAGLRAGEVSYAPGLAVPLGEVAGQQPAAGDSVRAGTAVSITISGSPPTGTAPAEPAAPADTVAAVSAEPPPAP
jgi:beta-lactam-binding protein with PASTA domain